MTMQDNQSPEAPGEQEERGAPAPLVDLSAYPPLLRMREVGGILRCSEQTVRRRMREGKLTYIRGEKGPLIVRDSVQRYLEERAVVREEHP